MPLQRTVKHALLTAMADADRYLHPPEPSLAGISRFLLLQYPAALGSAIHATPLIPALRAAVPQAEISVCASGFALEIFRRNPGVDRLIGTPDPTKQLLPAVRAIRGACPVEPFATITSTSNERTSIALSALLAGVGNRVGFTLVPELYRAPLAYDSSLSQIANNLRIVEALGHPAPRAFEPQVFFGEGDLVYARGLLAGLADEGRPLVVFVTQTSPTQRKSWRADRYVAVAEHLIATYGADIVLVGSRSERAAVEALAQRIGSHAVNVAGETDLAQLAALLSLCRVGLTLDTGTMHMGRAVGLPMVIIAPAWSPPVEWLPLNDPRFIILKNLEMATAPPDYIIDEVSVDEVLAALDGLLRA